MLRAALARLDVKLELGGEQSGGAIAGSCCSDFALGEGRASSPVLA